MSPTTTTNHVACPGCGCVCDDLSLEFDDGGLTAVSPACHLAESWFSSHWETSESGATIEAQPVELDAAIERAAEILQNAEYPLIYGLSRGATSGQRAAVALAEKLGGVVDSTASLCHGPSIMAIQEVGEVTSTLGEIRNRADLVIFWGCDPANSHPRHADRYSVFPQGRFVRNGRSDRTVVMVGDASQVWNWSLDLNGTKPDVVIPLESGSDFEVLSCLRAMLHGQWNGVPPAGTRELLQMMKVCRYGVVFFGLGLAKTSMWESASESETGHNDVAALLKLVAELNAVTRFTARRMRLQGDVSGADNVLCWQTGYPFGVDFSRGYPRYNPGEYTANELLARGDVDACLLVGGETVRYFSAVARQHLESIPVVRVDYPNALSTVPAAVEITTAVHGIHASGTIYRMDNVPISLRELVPSPLPTDEDVLKRIMNLVVAPSILHSK